MHTTTVVDIIRAKRDGSDLSEDELQLFCSSIAEGLVSDTRIGAFVMAVFLRGLSIEECAALTRAMANSGWQSDWSTFDLPGPLLDKHSTGGLGDIVSFLLGPMVAACGGYVPMISGRSLEHTGGTVDKLESIPGYDAFPEPARFQQIVAEHGIAIVGQTKDLVPADQRLYAARDQTATVESVPLIAASVLSKKLAEGLDGLVIDLKVGSGAFMRSEQQAQPLARYIRGVADSCGLKCKVVSTSMNQPLANCVGDGVEMREALRFLTGERRSARLLDTTMKLAGELLTLGGLADSPEDASEPLRAALDSGHAAERFQRMIHALGGPSDLLEHPDSYLDESNIVRPFLAARSGQVHRIDGRELGNAIHHTANLRGQPSFDHRVGIADLCRLGDAVEIGQPLATIHARTEAEFEHLASCITEAVEISENQMEPADEHTAH